MFSLTSGLLVVSSLTAQLMIHEGSHALPMHLAGVQNLQLQLMPRSRVLVQMSGDPSRSISNREEFWMAVAPLVLDLAMFAILRLCGARWELYAGPVVDALGFFGGAVWGRPEHDFRRAWRNL